MTVEVPITISGDLRAWTYAGRLSHQAPFFDYQIRESGTLSASFDISPDSWNISVASFTGVGEPTPEPASWLLALPFGEAPLILFPVPAVPLAAGSTFSGAWLPQMR